MLLKKWQNGAVKVFEKKILPRIGVVEIFLTKPVGLDLYCTILTLYFCYFFF